MTKPLSAEQIAEIAWSDPSISIRALAERMGVTFQQVRFTRERIRREGLVSKIYWVTCVACGNLIAARKAHANRHRTCPRPTPKTPQKRDRAQLRAAGRRYIAAHPEQVLRNRAIRSARDQEQHVRTIATANRVMERWTAEEDARVIGCRGRAELEAAALAFGRTYLAVVQRRGLLRRRAAAQASNAPNQNSSQSI